MKIGCYIAVCAALKVLEQAGISLAAIDAAAADDASTPPDVLLAIINSSDNSTVWGNAEVDSLQESSSSSLSSDAARSSSAADLRDDTGKAAAAEADGIYTSAARDQGQQQQQQHHPGWFSTAPGSSSHSRFEALALLRRLLVLSRQQPGPAGLLSNTAAVDALQELLPFAPLMQLATQRASSLGSDPHQSTAACSSGVAAAVGVPGSFHATAAAASGSLLGLLPPAQRAWLLADAAAAVLLPAENKHR
jgi:hypothetical protein